MTNARSQAQELEHRLARPKRVGLFGHRNVGKTTLLAMLYRQAAGGQVPGVRLAAADPSSAEYLADKIAQIEAGTPLAGTLAETELRLSLYHRSTRCELLLKDYQGEYITLGSDEPIREFFAGCDLVLLCLDPDNAAAAADRYRRQQEIEGLLERFLAAEPADLPRTDRPVALLATKYDRILDAGGPPLERVDEWVEAHYGMTRYALSEHCPRSAVFAVSSYGPAPSASNPPAELAPLNLDRPLDWIAEQIETIDRELLEQIWDLTPNDPRRLARCLRLFSRQHPNAAALPSFRRWLGQVRRRQVVQRVSGVLAAVVLLISGLFAYDALDYRFALAAERADAARPAEVLRSWRHYIRLHPTIAWTWPAQARAARRHAADAQLALVQAELDREGVDLDALRRDLASAGEQLPERRREIERLAAQLDARSAARRWRALQQRIRERDPADDPQPLLGEVAAFLRDRPDGPLASEALRARDRLQKLLAERRDKAEHQAYAELLRAEAEQGADQRSLMELAGQFLERYPQSALCPEVEKRQRRFAVAWDAQDIQRARDYAAQNPESFQTRLERYQDYLDRHGESGAFVNEALEAKRQTLAAWDRSDYRQVADYAARYPQDIVEVAHRLRKYLQAHPEAVYQKAAHTFLERFEKVSRTEEYTVVLKSGEFPDELGHWFGAGPSLAVEVEVAGVKYGPSPTISDSFKPIWDYEFPQKIRWKLGDPVEVRVIDHDWRRARVVAKIVPPADDPLALQLLSGAFHFSNGRLVFSSDFQPPELPPAAQP